ncbi:class I SAM-dependent methyltransferase [Hymenobacter busanensis]|uniref:Class I SAM-dependent methyltransferase n=1 Tax=Hymenobacter busanensis TaxID=2607656 RepID=A0A7L4ZUA1_9BACT|nr:class I SAM-dependent methyltransferase [Hymenobacter busanensis]KAA9339244.1 class I SAM-dependent methyltransferase [Hymenobacter busanensis]QHJ06994.1 methyltransferase domain-containing protein [Hymenobacter busanensis]
MNCRHCGSSLHHVFADLGHCPPANSMLSSAQLDEPELHYPLKTYVCDNCFLVQVGEVKKAVEIFGNEYTYFSSYSSSWLEHARRYVDMMMERFGYTADSLVVEAASNDGYLLQYFRQYGVPVLGIDPTANTAHMAAERGIETLVEFFTTELARNLAAKGQQADLLICNNVLAHVPDINDFVSGISLMVKPGGVVTLEFPHLLNLVEQCQFDTIYHEHFSYLSLLTVNRIFAAYGLTIFDVEELPTHGGSLRLFARHTADESKPISAAVLELLARERAAGMHTLAYYQNFQPRVDVVRLELLEFLLEQKRQGRKVAGYGAAAKGNTLLSYCGIQGTDLIQFVVDASPHKQGKYLPGSHIPVLHPDAIRDEQPDYVLILPWNIRAEVVEQLEYIEEWGGRFAVAIPKLETFSHTTVAADVVPV